MKLFLTLSLVAFNIELASASNYPSDYCLQQVFTQQEGPSLVSRVKSGCLDRLVIGYKNSGILAESSPESVYAVITGSCEATRDVRVTTLELGKEWHGTGYLNQLPYLDIPSQCYADYLTVKISVAFTDGKGNWDSRYGQNYNVGLNALYKNGEVNQSSSVDAVIGIDSWDIIINKMK